MKRSLLLIILLFALFGSYLFLSTRGNLVSKAEAYETSCPPSMTDQQCLNFLQDQASKISKDQANLNNSISNEKYQQLTLNQRIGYLNSQIAITEAKISSLEVEIETKNVEIRILSKEIDEVKNRVSTMSQEIERLQNSVDTRISLSYKYSFITPVEIFLETQNFDTLLRKIKYIAETRKKDKEILSNMFGKSEALRAEEKILEEKQNEVLKKRQEIEEEKTQMFEEKENLSAQKNEQANLLAISRQNESEYQASLATLKKQGDVVTAQITQLIFNLFQSGQLPANTPVKKGDVIGFQGHTGLAYGSHLHFELRQGGTVINPYSTGHFTWPNGSGSSRFPLDGAVVTQFPHYNNSAIDMVSTTHGNQSGDKYWTNGVTCSYGSVPPGYYNLRGEGAPLRAIRDGHVSNVFTDVCGGRAVIVNYGGGLTALYLHLR